jgi:hypothetical protein
VAFREEYIMKNYVIVNQGNGVFVGTMLGMFFFSNLDTVGQDSVLAYINKEEVDNIISSLNYRFKEGTYKSIEVEVKNEREATKEEIYSVFPELVWFE